MYDLKYRNFHGVIEVVATVSYVLSELRIALVGILNLKLSIWFI